MRSTILGLSPPPPPDSCFWSSVVPEARDDGQCPKCQSIWLNYTFIVVVSVDIVFSFVVTELPWFCVNESCYWAFVARHCCHLICKGCEHMKYHISLSNFIHICAYINIGSLLHCCTKLVFLWQRASIEVIFMTCCYWWIHNLQVSYS